MSNTRVYTGVFALFASSVFNICFCFMHAVFEEDALEHINVQKMRYLVEQ